MLRTTLTSILAQMEISTTDEQFEELILGWSNLIPWPGTEDVLTQLYEANFKIAALSNGDRDTLTRAMQIFSP